MEFAVWDILPLSRQDWERPLTTSGAVPAILVKRIPETSNKTLFISPIQTSQSGTRMFTFYVVWLNLTWLIAFPFQCHGLILCYLNLCDYIASSFPWIWIENMEQQKRKLFPVFSGSSAFPHTLSNWNWSFSKTSEDMRQDLYLRAGTAPWCEHSHRIWITTQMS